MKWEQIEQVNKEMATTDIKGKDYVEVNQRVLAFRKCCAGGTISTEIVSLENGVVVIKATILDEKGQVLATGYAYEKENSTFINKTSYIENCETSAVGRALGFAGFGISTSIASADEVQTAILNQNKVKMITPEQIARIKELNVIVKNVLINLKKNDLSELTFEQAQDIITKKENALKGE